MITMIQAFTSPLHNELGRRDAHRNLHWCPSGKEEPHLIHHNLWSGLWTVVGHGFSQISTSWSVCPHVLPWMHCSILKNKWMHWVKGKWIIMWFPRHWWYRSQWQIVQHQPYIYFSAAKSVKQSLPSLWVRLRQEIFQLRWSLSNN